MPILVVSEGGAARQIAVGDLEYAGVRIDRASDDCGYPAGSRVSARMTLSPGGFPWPIEDIEVIGPDERELDPGCVSRALSRLPLEEPRSPGMERELTVSWVVAPSGAAPALPSPSEPPEPPVPALPAPPAVVGLAAPSVVVEEETVTDTRDGTVLIQTVRRVSVLAVELDAHVGPRVTLPAPPAWVGGAGERSGLLDVAYERGQLRFLADGPRSSGGLGDPGVVADLLRCSDREPALVRTLLVFRDGALDEVRTWPDTSCVHTRAEVAEEQLVAIELDGTPIATRPWAILEIEVPQGGAR